MQLRILSFVLILSLVLIACESDTYNGDDGPTGDAELPSPTATMTPGEDPAATPTEPSAEATPTTETDDGATPTATDTEATPTAEIETTETPAGSAASVDDQIDQIIDSVVAIRQLEPVEEIEASVIGREELRERLVEMLSEDYSQEQAELDVQVLWMMLLLDDRSIDLYQLQLDLLTEQILGYYDPEADELYVISEPGGLDTGDQITAAQEVVHALQDQHFDLTRLEAEGTLSDQSRAFNAVVEGDGNLTMIAYAQQAFSQQELQEYIQESQQAESPVFNAAPEYIQESLLFPYEAGVAFVQAIFPQGGYEVVNEALEDPPPSTEIILHPEKYLAEETDEPIEVSNPDFEENLENGWEESMTGTAGEWHLLQMLELNDATSAQEAAAGWGGSSFSFYTSDDDEFALALDTRWDTPEDAQEFVTALEEVMSDYEEDDGIWIGPERAFSISSTDDNGVLFLSATDESILQQMLSETE